MNRLLSLALPLSLAACGGSSNPSDSNELSSTKPRDTAPAVTNDQLTAAATGERTFGVDLYKQLAQGSTANLFFSPHSIDEALSMTYAGAAGETASQMRTTLAYTLPDDQIHAAMNGLDLALESRGQGQAGVNGQPFTLKVANALWGEKGFPFLASFLDTIAVNYGGAMHTLDFVDAAEAARTTINNWVASETSNKIQDLLPEGAVGPDTTLVLTNAVYFNASWDKAFDGNQTANAAFTRLDGSTVQVPMMHNAYEGSGFSGDSVSAVEIPYAGDDLSMIVIQPADLATFESSLTAASLDSLLAQLGSAQITLSLPKWTFTDSHRLATPLEALGMTDAFKNADFSGIDGQKDLVITDVIHKAYVAVDEAGTEAAAATAVVIGGASVEANQLTITIDHPFLFLIRDNATGAVVFFGRVTDPTAS